MITGVSVGSTIVEIAATDLAANSATRTVAVTVIPPMLATPTLNDSSNSGSNADNITNQTNLTFSVNDVQPNAIVTAMATPVGSSTQMTEATFTVNTSGNYTVELGLSEGVWNVIAIQTVAGIPSTSTDANTLRVTVDTTAPVFRSDAPTPAMVLGMGASADGYHNANDNSFSNPAPVALPITAWRTDDATARVTHSVIGTNDTPCPNAMERTPLKTRRRARGSSSI